MRQSLAIVAAMPEERDALLACFPAQTTRRHFHVDLHLARGGAQELVIACSGIGKVNAAATLALLLSDFDIGAVINIGCAGGLQLDQRVLDLVVPREVVYTDVDVVSFGHVYGQMYGEPPRFQADARLLALLDDVVASGPVPLTCHHGLLGSADAHIHKPEQIDFIRQAFANEVACVDMEGGAIAHVCTRFGVPFLILRALSDVPARGDGPLDFHAFLRRAAGRSAEICAELVRRLAARDAL